MSLKNLEELYILLSEIANNNGFSPVYRSLNQLMVAENSWLQEQYVNFWQKQQEDNKKLIQEQTFAAQIADRDQTIQNLTSLMAECEQTVQNLTSQVAERDQIVDKFTSELNQVTNELEKTKIEAVNYTLSTSWRITRPLRKLKDLLFGKK